MDREGQKTSLIGHIQEGGYRTVNLDPSFVDEGGETLAEALAPESPETRRLTPDALEGTIAGEQLSSATDNTDGSAGLSGQTTIDQEAEQRLARREAEIARREQEIVNRDIEDRRQKAAAALRAEEDFVRNRINAAEDPLEKRAIAAEYRATRNARAAQALQAQNQQYVTQQSGEAEQTAKAQVILLAAQEHGIPHDLVPLLRQAETAEQMDEIIARLKPHLTPKVQTPANAATLRQQRLDSGVDTAGGSRVGFVPPAEPKQRSGDIMGLIQSRQHQLVNVLVEQ